MQDSGIEPGDGDRAHRARPPSGTLANAGEHTPKNSANFSQASEKIAGGGESLPGKSRSPAGEKTAVQENS
jgi:hypothetical protein